MLHLTTFEEFKKLAKNAKRVAISREIFGDYLTSVGVFKALAQGQRDAALLDSSDYSNSVEACIYMGVDQIAEFRSFGQSITIKEQNDTKQFTAEPLASLREFYNQYKCPCDHPLAKFAGGMIGFVSYDAIRIFEEIPESHSNDDNIPDLCFQFYATNIVFDKRSGKVLLTKVVEVSDDLQQAYDQALKDIERIIEKMLQAKAHVNINLTRPKASDYDDVEVDIDDAGFAKMVERAKEYIRKGDAFQIVPSRRFRKNYSGDDFDIYRALRVLNPSPYQFYIRHQDFTIVGASPERLVSLQHGIVETMPIAGTRPRGVSFEQDQALEQELLNDEKEMAEHMMLVDLGRNDVGRISQPGSVKVNELKTIKRYSRVMHIVSRVMGLTDQAYDAFDVLKAVFPAGTLSGAPKIRAMEIIDEIETSRRGVYGGAIVAIDNQGQMDSCITIRTAFVKDGVASVRAGAGVVLDSDPQKEADETWHKARSALDAIALAEKGFV